MQLTNDQRFEVLKLEMQLLQGTFDKYDQLIFQSRSWLITLWLGVMGAAFTIPAANLTTLAVAASALYWLFEGLMRHQYWYKYVVRYRLLRDWLNRSNSSESIAVYDLSNHYGVRPSQWERLRKSFFKLEPTVVYVLMAVGALLAQTFVPVAR